MTNQLTITPRLAAEHGACLDSFRRMARHLKDQDRWDRDVEVPIVEVLDVLGFDDALWGLEAIGADKKLRLFAADCADHVLHLFEAERPDDARPREAIRVARLRAHGLATREAAEAASGAAWDAWAASGASRAAWDAWAASGASGAPWDAEREWQTSRLRDYLEGRA